MPSAKLNVPGVGTLKRLVWLSALGVLATDWYSSSSPLNSDSMSGSIEEASSSGKLNRLKVGKGLLAERLWLFRVAFLFAFASQKNNKNHTAP